MRRVNGIGLPILKETWSFYDDIVNIGGESALFFVFQTIIRQGSASLLVWLICGHIEPCGRFRQV